MNCLRADQIYLFLEGELSAEENRSIEAHISSCGKCKNAVAERNRLVEASQSLTAWEVPQDFSQRVLASIFPAKITFRDWAVTIAIGLSSAVLAFFVVYLVSGQTLADLFINLNRTALNLFQNIVVLSVKAAKLISVGISVISKILSLIVKGLGSFTTILGPEIQVVLILFTVFIAVLLLLGARRKLLAGEKVT